METLANSWECEWTSCSSHPQHAEPSCCFNSAPGVEEEVFEPAQLIMISQLPAHSVDQLLMEDADGLVAHLETASDCDLRGQAFGFYSDTSPRPASADSHQALWSLPAGSSCISNDSRFQPHPQIHTHDGDSNSFKKRKRDWNPDPDPKKRFTLLGSGSEQYGYQASSGTFKLISETKATWSSSTLNFQQGGSRRKEEGDVDAEAIQQMKEMMYRAAALRPVNLGAEVVEKPRRKNVRISSDPQTVAARQRRERISERLRVLQKLVPGGCKMDTASMLDEAANYLKFLRSQVKALEAMPPAAASSSAPPPTTASTSISSSPSLISQFSANQLMTPGTFNLANRFPTYYYNRNDDRNDDDDDGGGRISMISYHPIPIPIPIAAAMRHNPTSNPPFLLQQYAKS